MRSLVKEELNHKPAIATVISECMNEGKLIPETMITPLIVKRLQEPDCLANGWVLDGFP
jgi:adenylate kinase